MMKEMAETLTRQEEIDVSVQSPSLLPLPLFSRALEPQIENPY